MKICPYCSKSNREGLIYCAECGENLIGQPTFTTRKINSASGTLPTKTAWGTAQFKPGTTLILHIRDIVEPILLNSDKPITLGRADVSSTYQPDLDLNPFGAIEKGVSRIHARIYRTDETLSIVDLGSSNGTHLNGQRLTPDQPRVLRDGDEIRLAKLVAHIYFGHAQTS